jgi:hypothetical protein
MDGTTIDASRFDTSVARVFELTCHCGHFKRVHSPRDVILLKTPKPESSNTPSATLCIGR